MGLRTVAAAASVAILAALLVYLRGGQTPVPQSVALERFRSAIPQTPAPTGGVAHADGGRTPSPTARPSATPTAGATAPSATPHPGPDEGVYTYATSGGDRASIPGASHTFPDRTTITIRRGGCGLFHRWDALAERWDERELCAAPDGTAMRAYTSYHEFLRHGDRRTFSCLDGALVHPRGVTSWTGRCTAGKTVVEFTGTVGGRDRLDVGGTIVDAVNVRVEARISGDQMGTSRVDGWGDALTGLVLRQRSETVTDSSQPPFGTVRYEESYEIRLLSLIPLR